MEDVWRITEKVQGPGRLGVASGVPLHRLSSGGTSQEMDCAPKAAPRPLTTQSQAGETCIAGRSVSCDAREVREISGRAARYGRQVLEIERDQPVPHARKAVGVVNAGYGIVEPRWNAFCPHYGSANLNCYTAPKTAPMVTLRAWPGSPSAATACAPFQQK